MHEQRQCTGKRRRCRSGGTQKDAGATEGTTGDARGEVTGGSGGVVEPPPSDASSGNASGQAGGGAGGLSVLDSGRGVSGAGGTGGSSNSSTPSPATITACTDLFAETPCGGDVTGTWVLEAMCAVEPNDLNGVCYEHWFWQRNGALALSADGTYQYDDELTGLYVSFVCSTSPPPSCDTLTYSCFEDESGRCPCPTDPNGVCHCPGPYEGTPDTSMGTWSIDPMTQRLLLSEDWASIGGFDYCVQNDTLLLDLYGQLYVLTRDSG